jgi:hypothetical protein
MKTTTAMLLTATALTLLASGTSHAQLPIVILTPEQQREMEVKKENEDKASRVSQLPKCDLMTASLLEKAYNNSPYIKVLSLSDPHETGFSLGGTSEKGAGEKETSEIRRCTAYALLGHPEKEYVDYTALWINGKAYFKADLPRSYLGSKRDITDPNLDQSSVCAMIAHNNGKGKLDMRAGPGTSYPVVKQISPDSVVRVGNFVRGWQRIAWGDAGETEVGWVPANYLQSTYCYIV